MNTLETRGRHTRLIPYGEFGGPIFNPKDIKAIKDLGNKQIDLSAFLSDHGLTIIKGHENFVASLLAQYDQETHFIEKIDEGAAFKAFNVEHVANALRYSRIEELTPHIEGGTESLSKIGQWLAESVRSGS